MLVSFVTPPTTPFNVTVPDEALSVKALAPFIVLPKIILPRGLVDMPTLDTPNVTGPLNVTALVILTKLDAIFAGPLTNSVPKAPTEFVNVVNPVDVTVNDCGIILLTPAKLNAPPPVLVRTIFAPTISAVL